MLGRQRVQHDELAVDRVSDACQGVVIALSLHELALRSFRKGTTESIPRDRKAPVRRGDRYRNHQTGLDDAAHTDLAAVETGDGFVLQCAKVRLNTRATTPVALAPSRCKGAPTMRDCCSTHCSLKHAWFRLAVSCCATSAGGLIDRLPKP